MAFPNGNKKPPGSGRKKGTKNKITENLLQVCEEMGVDPFRALLSFHDHPNPALRLKAMSEASKYVYPQKRAVEVGNADEKGFRITIEDYVTK